jgi:hypothetical protein
MRGGRERGGRGCEVEGWEVTVLLLGLAGPKARMVVMMERWIGDNICLEVVNSTCIDMSMTETVLCPNGSRALVDSFRRICLDVLISRVMG